MASSAQGFYAVTLDGDTIAADGFSIEELFNMSLFNHQNLAENQVHHLVLQNNYDSIVPSYVDLDYMVLTVGDGSER